MLGDGDQGNKTTSKHQNSKLITMTTLDAEDVPTRRRKSRLTVKSGDSSALSEREKEASKKSKKRKKKQPSRRDELDPPFYILLLQVGTTLFVLCTVSFYLYRNFVPYEPPEMEVEYYQDDYQYDNPQEEGVVEEAVVASPTAAPTKPTPPPLPVWELGNASKFDAFAMAEKYEEEAKEKRGDDNIQYKSFWAIARSLREQFAETYGGENAARAILERSMTTFQNGTDSAPPGDLVHTACRIKQAKDEDRPFKFTFGGYSVTVGRGNYFSQSFPFVMQRLLETPFRLLGIDLVVRNAAIGGCPSFPYGFCKKNHWGSDSDVVSWDFSMNEAGGIAEGLEAYLRQTMTLDHRPKLLVKDTHMADKRRGMLQRYVEIGAIQDSVVIHSDPGVRPFLERPEEFRPMGFQEWRKFGSPVGAPGQALHHPAVKEHELNGWILAMHFLSALELLAAMGGNDKGGNTDNSYQLTCPTPEEWIERQSKYSLLPPPVTVSAASMQEWSSLFFGMPTSSEAIVASPSKNNNNKWKMNPVHCRTTYDPIVDQAGTLTSIVVAGSTAEDMDLMLPKGHMFYNEAWVLDLSEGEKDAKRKLDRYDGLGYVDSKKAYRGLFTSGALRLLIPYERHIENKYNKHESAFLKVGDRARDWFQTIVVCEVNERREPGSCELGKDVIYKVGGQNATNITLLDTPGTLYLGKKICSFVRVPEGATLTTREAMLMEDIRIPDHDKRKEKARQDLEAGNTTLGLALELSVHNHRIVARERACSLSHVVWEQRRPEDPRFPLVTEARRDKIDDASIGSSNSNNNDNGGNTENHHDPPAIIEAGNVEGAENIKPLKDYAVGVPQ